MTKTKEKKKKKQMDCFDLRERDKGVLASGEREEREKRKITKQKVNR